MSVDIKEAKNGSIVQARGRRRGEEWKGDTIVTVRPETYQTGKK